MVKTLLLTSKLWTTRPNSAGDSPTPCILRTIWPDPGQNALSAPATSRGNDWSARPGFSTARSISKKTAVVYSRQTGKMIWRNTVIVNVTSYNLSDIFLASSYIKCSATMRSVSLRTIGAMWLAREGQTLGNILSCLPYPDGSRCSGVWLYYPSKSLSFNPTNKF